jgi:hypothetical protein
VWPVTQGIGLRPRPMSFHTSRGLQGGEEDRPDLPFEETGPSLRDGGAVADGEASGDVETTPPEPHRGPRHTGLSCWRNASPGALWTLRVREGLRPMSMEVAAWRDSAREETGIPFQVVSTGNSASSIGSVVVNTPHCDVFSRGDLTCSGLNIACTGMDVVKFGFGDWNSREFASFRSDKSRR